MVYSIGEVAKLFNIAPSTLRYYEKEGLLSQVKRKSSGVREFDEQDCRDLLMIDSLKRCGMSIKEISRFADLMRGGTGTLQARSDVLRSQVKLVKRQLKEQKAHLRRLEYEAWLYEKAIETGSMEVAEQVPLSMVPKKLRKAKKKLDALVLDSDK